jgi:hypothetical protein
MINIKKFKAGAQTRGNIGITRSPEELEVGEQPRKAN